MKSYNFLYILPSFFAACHGSTLATKPISVRLPVKCSTSDPELCKLQHPDKSSLTFVLEGTAENWGMTSKTDEKNVKRSLQCQIPIVCLLLKPERRARGLKMTILKKPNVSGHWSGRWGRRVSLLSLIKQATQMRGRLDES